MRLERLDLGGDWDYLIILDSCRYDYFARNWNIGKVEAKISWASCTLEFLENMRPIPSSVVITGHPFITLFKHLFTRVIDAGFDYNLSTCPPRYVTSTFIKNLRTIKGYKRKILWFLQPHHPFIGETKLDIKIFMDRRGTSLTPAEVVARKYAEAKKAGILEKAYEDNLKLVLEELRKILPFMKGRIVITSDHGEGLGSPLRPQDKPVYGHPCNRSELELRLIPYCVIDSRGNEHRD